ncbi:MAG: hypothetical protein LBF09_05250 [Odoribacteraceae bacterium]|jgi:hypothetical protein|nr:hypothetical protein [Odoribacteraceae bacterium]
MKTWIYFLLLFTLVEGCIEDNGNYKYSALNTIEITGITADTTFRVDQFDTLRLDPALRFSAGELTDLSYEWKINHEVVSTERVLNAEIPITPSASLTYYLASLGVTDNATGLKYYKNFRVIVTTSVTNGLFVLSEQADETAKLSFQRRDKPNALFVHDLFENANPTSGALGKKPRQVYYQGAWDKQLGVVCEEGERVISQLNPATLELIRYYSKETIRGGYNGIFAPGYLVFYMGGMVASEGKLFSYDFRSNGSIFRPIPLQEGTYEFANWVDTNEAIDYYAWVSYDNKGEQFVLLEPGNIALVYDKISPIPVANNLSTTGQRFLAAGTYDYQLKAVILYNSAEQKAYLYSVYINYDFDAEWNIFINKTVTRLSEQTNLINEQSVCFYNAEYWYIANGSTVKRLHEKSTIPNDWFTAPKGNVTTMITKTGSSAAGTNRLFIATYDGAKSYIYEIDLVTKQQLNEPLEIDGKVVSLLAKGTWSY